MDDKRTDNVELRDKVISALLESKSTPLTTNYEVIQKLTHNFATFIETTGIAIPNLSMLLTQLKGDDPGAKLVFIQTQLAPRISNIDAIIGQQIKAHGVVIAPDKIEKCIRYLRAMVEIANQ